MKVRDVNNLNLMTFKGTIYKKKPHFQINIITFLVPPKTLLTGNMTRCINLTSIKSNLFF